MKSKGKPRIFKIFENTSEKIRKIAKFELHLAGILFLWILIIIKSIFPGSMTGFEMPHFFALSSCAPPFENPMSDSSYRSTKALVPMVDIERSHPSRTLSRRDVSGGGTSAKAMVSGACGDQQRS